MNKTAIKNFAVWARRKLIADITYKAGLLGITDKGIAEPLPQSTKDVQFFDIGTKDYTSVAGEEIAQRNALVSAIKNKAKEITYKEAFEYVVEEVAYTWFNRLIAIRFMEVNDYLPSKIRVLSSENPTKKEPDIVTNPFDAEIVFTSAEQDKIMQLKDENKLDELFRMLFIKQCNELNNVLPALFERTSDYTEMLLTISFTDTDGVVHHLVNDIPEDDFNVEKEGQVEIIGWLYQYYNTEKKDDVFAALKKNVKISKENIPAATQLFTPDWIVRYMTENSLGRLWVEGHPNDELKGNWKYYLDEAEQKPEVQVQLAKIREEYAKLSPEDIKVIDPCMGSGHILVYAFDVLMQIYESQGYTQREAAKSILQNNIYGLDIDDRAYQLAYFAVMMKARQYNRRIFNEGIKPNLCAIQSSKPISANLLARLGECKSIGQRLVEDFKDAKEYGSILNIGYTSAELDAIDEKLNQIDKMADYGSLMDMVDSQEVIDAVEPLIFQAHIMAQKYDAVITNPPYMGSNGMGEKLTEYLKSNYPDSKSDLFAVFIEKCGLYTKDNGYYAMITQPSILFLTSFTRLREKIIDSKTINSLLHMGRGIFGIDFGSTAFVIQNSSINQYVGEYFRLHERTFQYINPEDIADLYLRAKENKMFTYDFSKYTTDGYEGDTIEKIESESSELKIYFEKSQNRFNEIPGSPIAYWLSEEFIDIFSKSELLGSIADSKQGIATADNNRFLRQWFEVANNNINFNASSHESAATSECKWYPYNKGGEFRKWYGNDDYVINWLHDGEELKNFKKAVLRNPSFYFKTCFSWSLVSSGIASFRYKSSGKIFDVAGMSCFSKENLYYLLGLCNSKVATEVLRVIAPTINYQCGDIANIPVMINDKFKISVENNVKTCINESKSDWDSYEISWDFLRHPLLPKNNTLTLANNYKIWEKLCESRFNTVKEAEYKNNKMFISIYGLEKELIPDIKDEHITIRKADLKRDIKSLLSYAIGCMLGRYSLDKSGLAYAGGEWHDDNYKTFIPDKDNCIPITDEEYFEDDIVGLFCVWLKKVFGEDTLEENLDFIAKALGNKGTTSREVIRNYFMNDFIKDHIKIYQKRPIYWMFDSGKQNGFKALVYMHRWNADTIGNVRVEYLHSMQRVYENEIIRMQEVIDNSNNSKEITAATKRKEKLQKQLKETKDYDAQIAHLALSRIDIDLDDGVKVNYEKVQTGRDGKKMQILAKI